MDSKQLGEYLVRLLRVLAAIDGSNMARICEVSGFSLATVKRHINLLRRLGVKVATVRAHPHYGYKVEDYGPFDPSKLRRAINARV